MLQCFRAWMRTMVSEEKGQDLAEYALLIALIAVVVVAALLALGPQIATIFNTITANLAAVP